MHLKRKNCADPCFTRDTVIRASTNTRMNFMRRLVPPTVVFLTLMAALLVDAESAKSLWEKGQDAEARQNYEQAYELYRQAYVKPG